MVISIFLQIMIYLIEHVLPPNYFAHDLEALSVDLSVFQELTLEQMPELSNHLDILRMQSVDERGKSECDMQPQMLSLYLCLLYVHSMVRCYADDPASIRARTVTVADHAYFTESPHNVIPYCSCGLIPVLTAIYRIS